MKKTLILIGLVLVIIVCAFFGGVVHIGSPCDRTEMFWRHIGPTDSNHIPEFGGPDGVLSVLRGIQNGSMEFEVYGKLTKTIIAVPNSPYGPVIIIYGMFGKPTMFTTTMKLIQDWSRGIHHRLGAEDIQAAKNAAGCLADAYNPAFISAGSSVASGSASSFMLWLIAGVLVLGGFVLGGMRRLGGAAA